jgi:hypothetical protein
LVVMALEALINCTEVPFHLTMLRTVAARES